MKTQSFTLHTEQQGCYDITAAVCKSISDAGIQSGICTVFCPHTMAGIWIGENTAARYGERREVENGKPLLGTWQSVYFVECDGPDSRTYFVKVMADTGD